MRTGTLVSASRQQDASPQVLRTEYLLKSAKAIGLSDKRFGQGNDIEPRNQKCSPRSTGRAPGRESAAAKPSQMPVHRVVTTCTEPKQELRPIDKRNLLIGHISEIKYRLIAVDSSIPLRC